MFNKSFIVCIIIIILIICIYHIVNNVNCGCINGFSVGGQKHSDRKHSGRKREKLKNEILELNNNRGKIGDDVSCPNGIKCAGNQCCPDGSICPSADNSFTGCPNPVKITDCTDGHSPPPPPPGTCQTEKECPDGKCCRGDPKKCKRCGPCKVDGDCVTGKFCINEECKIREPHSDGINIANQPRSSVQIVNNTTEPWLHIFLQYSNSDIIVGEQNSCKIKQIQKSIDPQVVLPVPTKKWTIISYNGSYNLNEPNHSDDMQFSDIGKGSRWQKLSLKKGAYVILEIPDFVDQCPFRILPLKALTNKLNPDGSDNHREWCHYGALYDPNPPKSQRKDCGKITKMELGKDAGLNMSAVDGVNFKLKAEFSDKLTQDNNKFITTYFNKNPCDDRNCIEVNGNKKCGCINPAKLITMDKSGKPKYNIKGVPGSSPGIYCVDGLDCSGHHKMFPIDKGPGIWFNDEVIDPSGQPCYRGTCNLQGKFKKWADNIHYGQCATSQTEYPNKNISKKCGEGKGYTTYSYDYDDQNSLAYFSWPYKMKLTYYDLN